MDGCVTLLHELQEIREVSFILCHLIFHVYS